MRVKLGLGFYSSVVVIAACLVVPVIVLFVIRRKCRIDAAKMEEIKRLFVYVSEESSRAELEAATVAEGLFQNDDVRGAAAPAPVWRNHRHCAVCYSPSTKHCGRCKAVRYCSGKCQIIHWRQGHKDECCPLTTSMRDDDNVGSGPSQKVATQQYDHQEKVFETENKEQPKSVESAEEPALTNINNLSDISYNRDEIFEANMLADEERALSTSEFSSITGAEFSSSKRTSKLSDDAYVNVTMSSVDLGRLNSQVSLNGSADSLKETLGADDSDQMKPLSRKFANSVSSAHTRSKLSKSSCCGENASAFNESSALSIAGEKGRLASPSLRKPPREFSDFWGRAFDAFETKDDAQSNSLIDKISSDTEYPPSHSFDLPENTAIKTLSEGLRPKTYMSNDGSPATKESTSSISTCVNDLGVFKDSSLNCNMSLCVDNDTCKSSPVLDTGELRSTVSASTFAPQPVVKDADNSRVSHLNKLLSSGSRRADQFGSDAAAISVHLPDSSRGGCATSTSNTYTTSSLKKKSDDVHGTPAISSEVIRRSSSSKNRLRTPASILVDQFGESKLPKHYTVGPGNEAGRSGDKGIFPYEMFVKLYTWNKAVLSPCGLINCGNSCYANTVLQCLAFTPPLTAYFLQGLHCKTCIKDDWCFSCEFERLVLKVKEGVSPISPIKILSQLQNIGSHLGNGREEDAHEFLRCAIENMQSVFLTKSGLSVEEETTLVGLTFGGHLLSKIKCTRCKGKSERQERMMDLTVEIDGDIRTLEEALRQFTRSEILDGENKYHCSRCKTYEKAIKKLTVLEAPNVLTIALKRFQAGRFGKLNKPIRFPEILDMAPYMSRTSDKLPIYRLYAVVVHLDIMSAAFSGHYICYVKNIQNNWFKADDSTVTAVELDKVLTKDAYMLLYARCSPRAPRLIRDRIALPDQKTKFIPSVSCGTNISLKSRPASAHPDILHFRSNSTVLDRPSSFDLYSRQPQKNICEEISSDSSSLISSNSDEGSCSTDSTHDSLSTDDFSDNVFGDTGGCGESSWKSSSSTETNSSSYSSSPLYFKTSTLADFDRYATCSSKRSDIQSDLSDSALGGRSFMGKGNIGLAS